jgi:hypothetical protein
VAINPIDPGAPKSTAADVLEPTCTPSAHSPRDAWGSNPLTRSARGAFVNTMLASQIGCTEPGMLLRGRRVVFAVDADFGRYLVAQCLARGVHLVVAAAPALIFQLVGTLLV